jgi:large subunit ribosomal protein L22
MTNSAKAATRNASISSKHAIVLADAVRNKSLETAKKILKEVLEKKKALPFLRFNHKIGHRKGMASGRYPEKATQKMLELVESLEANAQYKGLNTADMKIVEVRANRASRPLRYGRMGSRQSKRTHIDVVAHEVAKK